jgi:HMG-box domain
LRIYSAKADRKRYEEEMAEYNPPDKNSNRKRNKTGYNMFFSAHVLRLKQTESGVPSERGSVARMVGSAWKLLSQEEKQYYEREADKHNGMNPPLKDNEDDEDDDDANKTVHVQMEHQQYGAYQPDMHLHAGVAGMQHQGAQQPYAQHDPRTSQHHGYYATHHVYAPNPYAGHYDYSQHHQRQPPQGRAAQQQHQQYQYPPAHTRNPYDHMGL